MYAAEAPPELYETHTYKLVSGTGDTDNSSFAIDSASGVVTTSETFDFESRSEYSIRVESKDAGGNKFTKAISITVADRQDAPTAITTDPESGTIREGLPAGTLVTTSRLSILMAAIRLSTVLFPVLETRTTVYSALQATSCRPMPY